MTQTPRDWIAIAQRIQAISQTGIVYARNGYDLERYQELSEIAAAMMCGPEPESCPLAKRLFAAEAGYATPKVDVRGAIFQDGRVLLVREAEDGCWTFPGGWAEVGQSAAESVEREVREESGYLVRAVKLLACWDRNKHAHPAIPFHAYKLLFLCEIAGGAPAVSSETTEVGFFAEDEIPPLSTTRTLAEQIHFAFASLRAPTAATVFD
ncbi:MAG TPA: NUDIX hydrolase [Bryobacteraceae bacterium]|nr:NUDIX hydrolase [Bryobacteraceae bacterium]